MEAPGKADIEALQRWMVDVALPLWSEVGFEPGAGRFHERLDQKGGAVPDVPHRAMVQARQIYVFAHAAQRRWFVAGADRAERAMRSLLRDFCLRSGGQASFAFSIDPTGQVVSSVRDAYAHAFLLFATAWLHRLTGERGLVDLADEIVAFVEAHLLDPVHGGLIDRIPPSADRAKRQNPQMHLLEAYLALDQAMPGRGHLERASALVDLFRRRMFEPEHGVLLEYFGEDWSEHPDPARRTIFEPGHHFEWVWLLDQYEKATGEDQSHWTAQLHRSAIEHGFSSDDLIFDEVQAGGRVARYSHRVWPHTEALKAMSVRFSHGDGAAEPLAGALGRNLKAVFLDRPFRGGWVDQVTSSREPLVDYVPASTFYHLFLAVSESADAFTPAKA